MKKSKHNHKKTGETQAIEASKVRVVSYNITYEPLPDDAFAALLKEVQNAANQLYYRIHKNPRKALHLNSVKLDGEKNSSPPWKALPIAAPYRRIFHGKTHPF